VWLFTWIAGPIVLVAALRARHSGRLELWIPAAFPVEVRVSVAVANALAAAAGVITALQWLLCCVR
jgi:hypothetical protein